MIKARSLKAQEQQIVHCLRQHDFEGALQLIVAHFHQPLYWAVRKWVLVHEGFSSGFFSLSLGWLIPL